MPERATMTLPNHKNPTRAPLKRIVSHPGHELKQVWRDQTHAVYQHFGDYGQFIGWEAIRIKDKPPEDVFGKRYPEREVYPSAEDFGRYDLSVGAQYDLEYAVYKAKSLQPRGPR